MKGLRSIPRVLKINEINGYQVSCLFNNGESRIIDFEHFFLNEIKINPKHIAYEVFQDQGKFKEIKLIEHSIGWDMIGVTTTDFEGKEVFYPYELDPLVLYKNSALDEERSFIIGRMIRQARKAAGLTQDELAYRSGTSKHYISRIENNKSDIEVLTLKKIVEAGLGKTLHLSIG